MTDAIERIDPAETAYLSPDELATIAAAQRRVQRTAAEHRLAQATLDVCLAAIQEAYGLATGDKVNPITGEILRADTVQGG